MIKSKYVIFIFTLLLIVDIQANSCIVENNNREIVRNEFTFHETIQSENFVIHFTTIDRLIIIYYITTTIHMVRKWLIYMS